MSEKSSDFESGTCEADLPQNIGLIDATDSHVTPKSQADTVLDGAGRKRNGRQSHGVNLVKRATHELNRSRKVLDRRTGIGKWRYETRLQLVEAIGGADVLTPQLEAVIDSTVNTQMLLGHVDAYLGEIGAGIVNRRRRTLIPVAQQRTALADSLLRHLDKLGLERRTRTVDPREYLSQYDKKQEAAGVS